MQAVDLGMAFFKVLHSWQAELVVVAVQGEDAIEEVEWWVCLTAKASCGRAIGEFLLESGE